MLNSANRRDALILIVVAVTTCLSSFGIRSASAQKVWDLDQDGILPFSAIDFIDDQVGFVAGYGVILKTTDGGQTWTNIFPEYLFGSDQSEIAAVSADAVWTVGSPSSTIRWTTDGGQTVPWGTRVLANDYGDYTWITRMGITGDGTVILVGQVGGNPHPELIIRTTDGTEFRRIEREYDGDEIALLFDIAIVGKSTAWVVGTNSGLLKSEDSGLTWERRDFEAGEEDNFLQHVFFLEDGITGWIASLRHIWRTTDGGDSWQMIANIVGLGTATDNWERVRRMYFLSPERGWLITEFAPFYTVDGGETWTRVDLGPPSDRTTLNDLTFTSRDNGWLVGGTRLGGSNSPGVIYHTSSGSAVATSDETPSEVASVNVYPNPMSASAQIQFTLDAPEQFSVRVYDLLGRDLETLTSTMGHEGVNRLAWRRDGLSAGFYLLRLTAGSRSHTVKVMVVD